MYINRFRKRNNNEKLYDLVTDARTNLDFKDDAVKTRRLAEAERLINVGASLCAN